MQRLPLWVDLAVEWAWECLKEWLAVCLAATPWRWLAVLVQQLYPPHTNAVAAQVVAELAVAWG